MIIAPLYIAYLGYEIKEVLPMCCNCNRPNKSFCWNNYNCLFGCGSQPKPAVKPNCGCDNNWGGCMQNGWGQDCRPLPRGNNCGCNWDCGCRPKPVRPEPKSCFNVKFEGIIRFC